MEQTFVDLLRERRDSSRRFVAFVLWTFLETCVSIARENTGFMITRHRNIVRVALVTGLLLAVPLVAMQFSDDVQWNLFDFLVAGALLFGTGLAYVLLTDKARSGAYRLAAGVALGSALFLVWANLAVGLIGSENEPVNLLFFGVLATGITGAVLARFRPDGMARALLAMALAQALVAAIALAGGMDEHPGSSVAEILLVNGFFIGLFVLSAWLFRRAGGPAST